jgi:RimJ/RimL family protein N-acetyltransferase
MLADPPEAWALAGPRVRLRRLRAADTAAFHALRADPELGRYQGWSALSLAEAASFIEAVATPAALPFCPPGDWLQIAIADTASDTLLGDIGLHLHADGQALEIGFTLARAAQGRGLAAESVGLALQAVWAGTPAQRVLGITDARNLASVRLLQRLGFRPLATLEADFRGERCIEQHLVLHRPGRAAPLLRAATPADAAAVARVLIESRRGLLPFLPEVHGDEDVAAWVAGTLLPRGGVTVACVDGQVQGVLATALVADDIAGVSERAGWIEQLYVHPAHIGTGLGRALLAQALRTLPRPVWLYTFQANLQARAFYEHHGFVARSFGDGSGNEERCPDVLYELPAAQGR